MAKRTVNRPASGRQSDAGRSASPRNPQASPAEAPNSILRSSIGPLPAEQRRAMIAEAAYFIAEGRGFGPGRELEDWLSAECRIDAVVGDEPGQQGRTRQETLHSPGVGAAKAKPPSTRSE